MTSSPPEIGLWDKDMSLDKLCLYDTVIERACKERRGTTFVLFCVGWGEFDMLEIYILRGKSNEKIRNAFCVEFDSSFIFGGV